MLRLSERLHIRFAAILALSDGRYQPDIGSSLLAERRFKVRSWEQSGHHACLLPRHLLTKPQVFQVILLLGRSSIYHIVERDSQLRAGASMVEAASLTNGAGKPLRLLVVDDDRSACDLIRRFAAERAFISECAGSLEEARRFLSVTRYDCITLDLGMGKSSGVEVFKYVANLPHRCPIIVISAADTSVIDLALAVGNMNQLELLEPIAKPIDFAKLHAALSGIRSRTTAKEPELQRIAG